MHEDVRAIVGALPGWEHVRMEETDAMHDADQQLAEALAAERESLSTECRVDAARLEHLLAPDFRDFGTSGGEFGFDGTAARTGRCSTTRARSLLVDRQTRLP
jgi:hypothetical protein